MSDFAIRFEAPKHGWLPVHLEVGGKEFEFAGSDALNNPLDDLVSALEASANGHGASVWWFLEPGGYWFDFVPREQRMELRVYFGESMSGADRELVASCEAVRGAVLLAFWRAVKKIAAAGFGEPDWPSIDLRRLKRVREQLRAEG